MRKEAKGCFYVGFRLERLMPIVPPRGLGLISRKIIEHMTRSNVPSAREHFCEMAPRGSVEALLSLVLVHNQEVTGCNVRHQSCTLLLDSSATSVCGALSEKEKGCT